MCQKCVKKAKNLGRSTILTDGQIRIYAHRSLNCQSVPLFADKATNFAILAEAHRIQQSRTNKNTYSRNNNRKRDDHV